MIENLSDAEASKGKCIMAQIVESHADTSNDNVDTLDVDPSQVGTNFKEFDTTSSYQMTSIPYEPHNKVSSQLAIEESLFRN
uniref:Uncharacterized protein n=1 Tax=Lactuca sativa TaxID=4236 RepID=A0A9R1VVX2_LACSA|nr:hypothetical protein LSAT_V11C300101940 [Lactuca sativa]